MLINISLNNDLIIKSEQKKNIIIFYNLFIKITLASFIN
jgi:hypothetical protein